MTILENATNTTIYGGVFYAIQGPGNIATMERMKGMIEDKERQKIMAWVSCLGVLKKHFDVSDSRYPGTGEWLLKFRAFQEWEHGTGRALWFRGMPGAGKTVLASLVIDRLRAIQLRERIGTIGLAWIYFNYKDEQVQTPETILLSIIRQFAVFSTELYEILRSAYRAEPNSSPSARQLVPDMRIVTQEFGKFFIVIDALDECAERNRDTVLEILAVLQKHGANVIITSRDHVHDRIADSTLVNVQRIDIRANTEDIVKYVNTCTERQTRLARIIRTDPLLYNEIVKAIIDSCQGMFLMATFHIESLGKMLNSREILAALRVLPKTFRDIYDQAMHRVESDIDYSQFALRVLSFIIHSRRPLTVVELQHFLAIQPGDTDIDDKHVTDKDILISVCAGLVVIDDKTSIVRLVHYTTQEYFDNIRASKFPFGDQDMGHACLTYLSFDAFRDIPDIDPGFDFSDIDYSQDFYRRYALLNYIVYHWHNHVLLHQEALRTPLSVFFKSEALLYAYSCFMEIYRPRLFRSSKWMRKCYPHTGLHAATAAGLQDVVGWLIAEGANINSNDFTGHTALSYSSELGSVTIAELLITSGAEVNAGGDMALQGASDCGHEAVVRLLLDNGADVNAHNNYGMTVLHRASEGGHEAVVKLLLENGADIGARNAADETALQRTSGFGHEAVVRLLLVNGIEVNSPDKHDKTALQRASKGGHEAVVRLLLENGAEVNARDEDGGTAVRWASKSGSEAVVKLLLKNGADINAHDNDGNTALQTASNFGHEAVVRLLLENGADVNPPDKYGGTALQRASKGGHEAIVRLLLENGADVNVRDKDGGTALRWASKGGVEAVVKLLLENGADVNAHDNGGNTALQTASDFGHEAVVRLLLENGADVSLPDKYGKTALQRASKGGHEAVVRLLLEHGARDGSGETALQMVSSGDHAAVMGLLFENGARNEDYERALQMVSLGGHEAVMRLLLENGAEVNQCDAGSNTALQTASKRGHEAFVRLLLENGANVNPPDKYGNTALQMASEGGYEAVVRLLLENGADVNSPDKYGKTALHKSSQGGYEAVMRLLLKNGADVSARDEDGETSLQRALYFGRESVVRLLLEHGADANACNHWGHTVLHMASEDGREAVVRLLLENGAEVNAPNEDGSTALLMASDFRHEAVVRLLLENSADVNARDEKGDTPLKLASRRGYESIVRLLLDKLAEIHAVGTDYGLGDGSGDNMKVTIYHRHENSAVEYEVRGFNQEIHTPSESMDLPLILLPVSPPLENNNAENLFTPMGLPKTLIGSNRKDPDLTVISQVCRCGERIIDVKSEDVVQCKWLWCDTRFFHLICVGLEYPVSYWVCDACEVGDWGAKKT